MKFIKHFIKKLREQNKTFEENQKMICRLFESREDEFRVFYSFWVEELSKAESAMNQPGLSLQDLHLLNEKRMMINNFIDHINNLVKPSRKSL